MKIIYNNSVCLTVLDPILTEINLDTGKPFTIKEIAEKDVPTGYKYKIVEDSVLPTDESFRDAWYADESDLTDGVGGTHGNPAEHGIRT